MGSPYNDRTNYHSSNNNRPYRRRSNSYRSRDHKHYSSRSRTRSYNSRRRHHQSYYPRDNYHHHHSRNNNNNGYYRRNNYSSKHYDSYYKRSPSTRSSYPYHKRDSYNQQQQYKKKKPPTPSSSSSSSSSSSNSQMSQSDSKDRSKDAGHYKHQVGDKLYSKKNKYKILKHISDGTFGRVLEVKSYEDNKPYALKVIRAVDRYIDSAKTETEIIKKMQKKDPENTQKIVRLHETFSMDQNFAMVFEKLGPSLYDVIKKNRYKGFPLPIVQSFFKQTLEAIGFLHENKLTHTDLKPENILLKSSDLEKIYPFRKNKDKYIYVPDQKTTQNDIKIIDFGGATFSDEHHSSIINTRQYRAPEVILGCCQWSEVSDLWSIGCIIMELITGELFFQTHENYEHVALIEKNSGIIPEWMRKDAQQKDDWFNVSRYQDYAQNIGETLIDPKNSLKNQSKLQLQIEEQGQDFQEQSNFFNWPKKVSSKESLMRVKEMDTLEIIQDDALKNLLYRCLTIDPKKRITCKEALEHSFFSQTFKMEI